MPRDLKTVSTNFIKVGKPGDDTQESVEGTLIEKGSMTFGKAGEAPTDVGRYKVQQDEDDGGEILTFMGSVKIDDLMGLVEVGAYFRINYVGTVKTSGGQTMNDYELEVEEA